MQADVADEVDGPFGGVGCEGHHVVPALDGPLVREVEEGAPDVGDRRRDGAMRIRINPDNCARALGVTCEGSAVLNALIGSPSASAIGEGRCVVIGGFPRSSAESVDREMPATSATWTRVRPSDLRTARIRAP